ncbi:MAG: hypothetical protein FWG09_06420 [Synergistaceae bacterium]|nr:hypothetical protein [Synergistaceae bacterium]
MAINIASSMSPGYLQVNPYFNESASRLSGQYRKENLENEPDERSKEAAEIALKHKAAIKDSLELTPKEEAEKAEKARAERIKRERAEELKVAEKREAFKKEEFAKKAEDTREKTIVDELKSNERKVLSHEAAHAAVGGRFAGTPKYTRTVGPDGKSYITGGEVSVRVPPSSDPRETIRNMEQVRAAALAPNDPSPQDVSVAASAANAKAQAEAELAADKAEWGEQPEPPRNEFEATDRVPAEIPMVKKYESSVNAANEEPMGAFSSITSMLKEEANKVETSAKAIDPNKFEPKKPEPVKYEPKTAPEDNLYNTRQAMKVYYMTSSPKGLWTAANGFEKTQNSPALERAQVLNLAA